MKTLLAIIAFLTAAGYLALSPFWYYLQYRILVEVHASHGMWVIFWGYALFGVVMGLLGLIGQAIKR